MPKSVREALQNLIVVCKQFPGLNSDTEDVIKWMSKLTDAGKDGEAAIRAPDSREVQLAMELTLICNSFENAVTKLKASPETLTKLKEELDWTREFAKPSLPPEPWRHLSESAKRYAMKKGLS